MKIKSALPASPQLLAIYEKIGAGEGIRTLDPNLEKVVVTAELEMAERHVFDKGGSTPLDPAGVRGPSAP
jgi:hypothetical protein